MESAAGSVVPGCGDTVERSLGASRLIDGVAGSEKQHPQIKFVDLNNAYDRRDGGALPAV
jgi:hypothetical protein